MILSLRNEGNEINRYIDKEIDGKRERERERKREREGDKERQKEMERLTRELRGVQIFLSQSKRILRCIYTYDSRRY